MTEVVVTGTGTAVDGLRGPADLLEPYRRHDDGFDPETGLLGKHLRHRDRASRLASRAAEAALIDAGLLGENRSYLGESERTATVVSTNLGNLDSICAFLDTIAEEDAEALNPTALPNTSSNVTGGWIAIEHGFRAPNLTVSNGPTSGLDALHWARRLIRSGRADTVVVTGVEPDNRYVRKLLNDNDEPQWPDAAAAVVVESAAAADRRGARVRLALGEYRRGGDVDAAVAVLPADDSAILLAEKGSQTGEVIDLAAWAGRQSGALGVLQCVAAGAALNGGDGTALAVSCRLPGAVAAAMVFTGPRHTIRKEKRDNVIENEVAEPTQVTVPAPVEEPELGELRTLVARVLEVDVAELTDDAHLTKDLGVDSLMLLEVSAQIRRRYGVRLTDAAITKVQSLAEIHDMVRNGRKG
ncbi:beta-ketoacyl synthase N-terminal-like domain-containing protein [Nocardia sp. NPDC127526]|uniref:beta-ketoacyl synthase N-terminal-like domain-containing protein n=1 Tax=Nocardia sp. NPDC127526 TaxID=3345393 RepID=UPI00362CE57F